MWPRLSLTAHAGSRMRSILPRRFQDGYILSRLEGQQQNAWKKNGSQDGGSDGENSLPFTAAIKKIQANWKGELFTTRSLGKTFQNETSHGYENHGDPSVDPSVLSPDPSITPRRPSGIQPTGGLLVLLRSFKLIKSKFSERKKKRVDAGKVCQG